jgi:hypothetical protein
VEQHVAGGEEETQRLVGGIAIPSKLMMLLEGTSAGVKSSEKAGFVRAPSIPSSATMSVGSRVYLNFYLLLPTDFFY